MVRRWVRLASSFDGCAVTSCPHGGATRSSASSCTGRRRRCRRSRRPTSRSASCWRPRIRMRCPACRTPSGTRTRCASPTARWPGTTPRPTATGRTRTSPLTGSTASSSGIPTTGPPGFAATGAGYVVFVAKHRDGYCLWPTEVTNPNRAGWHCRRDVVGEMAEAVAGRGDAVRRLLLRRLDWTFDDRPVGSMADVLVHRPAGRLSGLRRRAGARADPPLPPERAVERHRVAQPAARLWPLLDPLLRAGPRRGRERPLDAVGPAARGAHPATPRSGG